MRAKNLLSLIKTINSRLIFKLLLYSLSLYFCFFSFWGYVFLFLVLLYAYFSSIERVYFKAGFISLFFLNIFLVGSLTPKWLSFTISLSLFFLLLSVTDFVFFNRKAIYSFFNASLFLFFLFLIFKCPIKSSFWVGLILFVLAFSLARENLIFYFNSFYRRFNLLSLSLAFIFIQFFSFFSFLETAVFYKAFFLALIYIVLKDFSVFYLEGRLNKGEIILYSICGSIITATAWQFLWFS